MNDYVADSAAKVNRSFIYLSLMDAFHDHNQVYLEYMEHNGYSLLSDKDKKHIIKQLKSQMDLLKSDTIGMAMLLDFIKRYDCDDTEDIGLWLISKELKNILQT